MKVEAARAEGNAVTSFEEVSVQRAKQQKTMTGKQLIGTFAVLGLAYLILAVAILRPL